MTNPDIGAYPVDKSGGTYIGGTNMYRIPASDAAAYIVGDFVTLTGAADATDGVPDVVRQTAGSTRMLGCIVGFLPDRVTENVPNVRLTLTERFCFVADDPDAYFEILEDGVATPLVAADTGLNIDIVAGTINVTTGIGGTTIDSSSAATTTTLPLRLISKVVREDNPFGTVADPAVWRVRINNHDYRNLLGV